MCVHSSINVVQSILCSQLGKRTGIAFDIEAHLIGRLVQTGRCSFAQMDETSSELRASVEPAHDGHSRFLSSPSLRDTGHGVGANAHGGSYRGEILSDNGGTAAGNKGSEVLSDGGGNGCGNEGSDQSADPPASAHPDVTIPAVAVQPPDHSRWSTLLGLWATLLSQVVRWPEDGAAGSAHVWLFLPESSICAKPID